MREKNATSPFIALHWATLPASLLRETRGATAVMTALALSSLVGFAGLGTEVGTWYVAKRNMQGAADSAAISAANAVMAGTAHLSEARSVAARYGLVNGTSNVTVTVNKPPTSGAYTTNANAVEVIISQPQSLILASLFLAHKPNVGARAVAVGGQGGNGCVVALDRSNVTDVTETGNTVVNLNNCSMYINSPRASALTMTGLAKINAWSAYISGNYSIAGQAKLSTTHGTFTGIAPIDDPYLSVPLPSFSGCNQTNFSLTAGAVRTLDPGVYCNGFSLAGGSKVTLNPGVYIIDRGSFSITGGSTLTGTGVTFVMTSSTGNNYATASVAGGSVITLSAPTTGATAGLAFFQDRNAPGTGVDSFAGGATQNINGAIYFPNQSVTYAGGSSTGGANCTQLVSLLITFNGNANFNTNCTAAGVKAIGGAATALVE